MQSKSIEGVSTSTTAFVGVTRQGPANRAISIESEAAYREVFGTVAETAPLSLAVHQFFVNGGSRAVVVRVKQVSETASANLLAKAITGDTDRRTGIYALNGIEAIGLLLTPDVLRMDLRSADQVSNALLEFCEQRRIFYFLEIPEHISDQGVDSVLAWAKRKEQLRSANSATYFPRLSIPDPAQSNRLLFVSPNGSMAGVVARTDAARGVWKAPAGTSASIKNVHALEFDTNRRTTEKLQGVKINPITKLPTSAVVASSAWTYDNEAGENEIKYIPVRRLMLFVEASLYRGLQWVIFEPNGETLWAQIRLNVSSFMNLLFRSGAFHGATARDAYFVKCDAETTSQADIDLGRINVEVGFAPVRPAEFVILKFQHKTSTSR